MEVKIKLRYLLTQQNNHRNQRVNSKVLQKYDKKISTTFPKTNNSFTQENIISFTLFQVYHQIKLQEIITIYHKSNTKSTAKETEKGRKMYYRIYES